MNAFDDFFASEPITLATADREDGFTIPAPGVEDGGVTLETRHAEALPVGHYPDQTTEEPVTLATADREDGFTIPAPGA